MPTSLAGNRTNHGRAGLTLIEMMIVVLLISLLAGLSFPALSAGIDTLRMKQAADSIAGILNQSLLRAERRQRPVEIIISRSENALFVLGEGPGPEKRISLPEGVRIAGILPPVPFDDSQARQFLVVPGGAVPRMGVVLVNQRGAQRTISVDPITGVPQVSQ